MQKREIILDFTSLLDVTLILLFFFIMFSQFEVTDSREAADAKIAEAEKEISTAQATIDEYQQALSIMQDSNKRSAENSKAIIAFSNGKSPKLYLYGTQSQWLLRITCEDEIIAENIPLDDSAFQRIVSAFDNLGIAYEDTVFCELILDGNQPGTATAYRAVEKVLSQIQSQYQHLFYSRIDTSYVSDTRMS
ncbi:hypothetical protein [Gemmiger sp.]